MAYPVHAQDDSTNTPPSGPPPGGHHHGDHGDLSFLTDAQRAELKAAHEKAIANNPSLATQEQQVRQEMEANRKAHQKPTADQIAAAKTLHQQMDAAMIAADPNVAPILAELKAHHHHGGHDGGPDGAGGPPPSDQ